MEIINSGKNIFENAKNKFSTGNRDLLSVIKSSFKQLKDVMKTF